MSDRPSTSRAFCEDFGLPYTGSRTGASSSSRNHNNYPSRLGSSSRDLLSARNNSSNRNDPYTRNSTSSQRQSTWCPGYGEDGREAARAPFDYGPLGPVGGRNSRSEVYELGGGRTFHGDISRARQSHGGEFPRQSRSYGGQQPRASSQRESWGAQYGSQQIGSFGAQTALVGHSSHSGGQSQHFSSQCGGGQSQERRSQFVGTSSQQRRSQYGGTSSQQQRSRHGGGQQPRYVSVGAMLEGLTEEEWSAEDELLLSQEQILLYGNPFSQWQV